MLTSDENMRNSKSRLLRLSSEDRTTGTNGRFTINILSSGGIIDNVKGYTVHSMQCANVFPNVPDYANVITLVKAIGSVSYDVIIPSDYYYLDDLITVLASTITTAIPDTCAVAKVGLAPVQKLAFTFTGDEYELKLSSTMASRLGLTADLTCPDGIQTTVQSIPNLIGETEVYMHSRTLAPNNLIEGSGSFSVIDKVDLDKPYGSMCYSRYGMESVRTKRYIPFEGMKTLRTVKITLRNRIGEILTLPDNFNFSVILIIYHK